MRSLPAPAWFFATFAGAAALAQEAGLLGAPGWVMAAALAAAATALAAGLAMRPALPWLCLAAGLLACARVAVQPVDPAAAGRAAELAGSDAVVSGVVAAAPRPVGTGVALLVRPRAVVLGGVPHAADFGSLSVLSRLESTAGEGDTVQVTGRLRLPQAGGGFDARPWLAAQGAWLEVSPAQVQVTAAGGPLAALAGRARSVYVDAVARSLDPPYSNLLVGVVLGVRTGIPAALRADLIATGLVHLLVLSGLKVAIVSRLAMAVLTPWLGRLAALPALALVVAYAAVGGATPAAVRAAAMGAIAVLGAWSGRPTHAWTSLAVTAAGMLAVDPALTTDPGFDLSFSGTAAILVLTPPVERALERLPGARRVPRAFREAFAVTCAAQIGTLPFTAADFQVVPLVAPMANALVLPLLPALFALGAGVALTSPVPAAAAALALVLRGLLAYVVQVANLGAVAPVWRVPAGAFPAWAGMAYYGSGLAALAARQLRGRRRGAALFAAVAFPLLVSGSEAVAWTLPGASATVLATGDGLAVLLTGPTGQRALFGTGPSPTALGPALGPVLPPWSRRLDALVVPGPGAGVAGGLVGLDRDVDRVVLPAGIMEGSAWRGPVLRAAGTGARIISAAAGDTLELAGLRAEVLQPRRASPAPPRLALRVLGPSGTSVCLLADLASGAQDDLAPALAEGPACDHLVLPPPWRSPPSAALVLAARATDVVVASAAPPAAASLKTIRPGAIRRTDQDGSIRIPL